MFVVLVSVIHDTDIPTRLGGASEVAAAIGQIKFVSE